jgi:hypothetical protein
VPKLLHKHVQQEEAIIRKHWRVRRINIKRIKIGNCKWRELKGPLKKEDIELMSRQGF